MINDETKCKVVSLKEFGAAAGLISSSDDDDDDDDGSLPARAPPPSSSSSSSSSSPVATRIGGGGVGELPAVPCFTCASGMIGLPPAIQSAVAKYGLVQHGSLPYGNCGWISVALRLGWSPDEVAMAFVVMAGIHVTELATWAAYPEDESSGIWKAEKRAMKQRERAVANALQAGEVATGAAPGSHLRRGAWMDNVKDLKTLASCTELTFIFVDLGGDPNFFGGWKACIIDPYFTSRDVPPTRHFTIKSSGAVDRWEGGGEEAEFNRANDVFLVFKNGHWNLIGPEQPQTHHTGRVRERDYQRFLDSERAAAGGVMALDSDSE